MDHLVWYFSSTASAIRFMPLLRAAFACILLYQIDCALVLALWLARKTRLLSSKSTLELHNQHAAILVLPTLLEAFPILTESLRRARDAGIQVSFTAGEPNWVLDSHHHSALAVVEGTRELNQRLAATGAPPVRAVQFDIEPYLLVDWKTDPLAVASQYAVLLGKLREATKRDQLELWLTVPFWFEHHGFRSTTLDRLAIDFADGLVVMAYRDTAARVVSAAEGVLRHADAVGRPVVVAIETSCQQPPEITFCRASQRNLTAALARIRAGLAEKFPAFSGLAVHQYAYWRVLSSDPEQGLTFMHTATP
jgi:hypothetical protein